MTRTFLVPLDGSPGSEAVLSTVETLARAEHARVRLLHVSPRAEPLVEEDGRVIAYADEEAARVSQDALQYLRTAAAALPGIQVEPVVRFGDPAEEIVGEAVAVEADLVAMATHRRAGLPRLLEGSVAERVLRALRIPVLIVTHGEAAGEAAEATGGPHGRVVRRYFWCAVHQREVEVELEERGLPGFRVPVAVRSCSVFDPPTAIDCERRCLDPAFRARWAPPVPGVIQRLS